MNYQNKSQNTYNLINFMQNIDSFKGNIYPKLKEGKIQICRKTNKIGISSRKRILLFFIILIMKIFFSLSIDNSITLKINSGEKLRIINIGYKSYIRSIYINEVLQERISSTYDFTEDNNIVKIIFKNQMSKCNELFKNCSEVYEIDFSDFDSSNMLEIVGFFDYCHSLKSIDISSWDVSKVNNISYLFSNCYSLTSILMPNFEKSPIEKAHAMFYNCYSLISVDLTRVNTSLTENFGNMFFNCSSLISLDLSHFDTTNVRYIDNMFNGCKSLVSLDISSFRTPSLQKINRMFSNCESLTSLDLSHFDTSKITDMWDLFKDCISLVFLDISNFDTSSVTRMDRMFYNCTLITSLDLGHFDTSQVTNMDEMFRNCESLVYLDISGFSTSKVEEMKYMFSDCLLLSSLDLSNFDMQSVKDTIYMFKNCPNLEYINLKNASPKENAKTTYMFLDTQKNLVVCTESEIISQNIKECGVLSCSENWRDYQKKIYPDNNNCVDDCSLTDKKYDYLSNCVSICPNETLIIGFKCIKCHSDCQTCEGPSNKITSNCKSCISPDKFLEIGNCVSNCLNGYYTDENDPSIKICKHSNYNNLAALYNVNDNTEIYDIIKEYYIPSYDPENDFEIINEGVDNVVFQITTLENQLKALFNDSLNNYNLSIIDINQCESLLKQANNISEEDNLILLKKEKLTNKAYEKEVQFEIYEPYNKTKLNLEICKETNINIYSKTELSEEIQYSYDKLKELGYNMFNINDSFYQDICTPYKSYENTDILLADRINYIYNNEDTKCQSNCELSEYSEMTKILNCSCVINEETSNIKKNEFSTKKIYESFVDVLKYSNYKVLKCYNLVFTKNLMTKNIGSIIIFIYLLVSIGCFITYIIKGINPLKIKMESQVKNNTLGNNNDACNNEPETNKNNDININNKINVEEIEIYKNKSEKNMLNMKNPPRKISFNPNSKSTNNILDENNNNININNNNNGEINIAQFKNKNKKRKMKKNTTVLGRNKIETVKKNFNCDSTNKMNNFVSTTKSKVNIFSKPIKITENNKIEPKNENIILDNFELNELDFLEAIKLDKRSFIQIYWSIIKREHPILFTFIICDDYNLLYIKLTRFLFLLANDMALNVFFFSDDSMHKLYINYGKYDFIQQIPQIIYSTIISRLMEVFLCFLSLTDKHIYQIIRLIRDNATEKNQFIFKCIRIKLISFFIFTSILFLLYWYIVAAFCSVYENTQTAFIKDCFFSFLLSLLFPFVLYLIPSSLRIFAIKYPNKKFSIYIYKLSDIIPIF